MIPVHGTRKLGALLLAWSERGNDAVEIVGRDFADGQEADYEDVSRALVRMQSRYDNHTGGWTQKDRAAFGAAIADLRRVARAAEPPVPTQTSCGCARPRNNPSPHHRTGVTLETMSETRVLVVVERQGAAPTLSQVRDQLVVAAQRELGSGAIAQPVVFDGIVKDVTRATTPGGSRIRTVVAMVRDGHAAVGHFMSASHDAARQQFVNAMSLGGFRDYTLLGVFLGKHDPVSPRSVYRVARLAPKGY